ncbi:biopolymer transporter ExbD [Caenimonas koreensis DSM 17982]|uniref:Biopolymer transporter ExbD n=1 Tax=Caenimonas koreensis DSM 17982 TaxID=1121255 RepID=A0A844B7X3_9BURK|nr:biopolymer transporter ExbD [Caenimonas koreensis]MRD49252.1 biopolymer transporter ExbD [Caenimonas koreensis DSM 17982]
MGFGRLERTTGSQPMSEINVTPLVDVMLVLVVIFILTAPLLASSIRLDLPKTPAAKPSDAPKFVTIVLDRGGQAFLDDKPVSQPELEQRLTQIGRNSPDTEIQLRADKLVQYGRIVEVMGTAQTAGLNRIGFIADPAAAAAAPAAKTAPAPTPSTAPKR